MKMQNHEVANISSKNLEKKKTTSIFWEAVGKQTNDKEMEVKC